MESMSCPLTPKSHSLISPREFTRMLEGLTSNGRGHVQKWNHAVRVHPDIRMRAGRLQTLSEHLISPPLHWCVNIHVGMCENPYTAMKEHVYIKPITRTERN